MPFLLDRPGRSAALIAVLVLAGHSNAADAGARTMVEAALKAMGQTHDLHQVSTLRTQSVKALWDVVEFDHADAPFIFQGVTQSLAVYDLRGDRRLTDEVPVGDADPSTMPHVRTLVTRSEERIDRLAGGQPAKTVRLEPPAAWEIEEPISALLYAEKANDLLQEPDVSLHGIPQHVVSFHLGRFPVQLFLDVSTGMPSAVEVLRVQPRADSSDIAYNAMGDLTDRIEWMNYAVFDGVRYPVQADFFRNGVHLEVTTCNDLRVNGAQEDQYFQMAQTDVPLSRTTSDELQLGQAVARAPNPKAPITEIAPGVVQIPGSWFTTIVRQPDGLVIIDAPISSGYSRKVLDEAARRFPGVPVKALVTSTAFYWHVAGIREYAARGIPIYARDRNIPVIRALLNAPHTLAPDTLARHPASPILRPVSQPTHLGQGRNAIVLYPVSEGEQPMLMSWIANAHLLHTAEMVMPLGPQGALLQPESLLELKHSVEKTPVATRGLRMIGMHMRPTPWSTLLDTLKKDGLGEAPGA
ncbi:MAG TPA: hypothetical protein VF738_01315 [Rhodanobacter sp.]